MVSFRQTEERETARSCKSNDGESNQRVLKAPYMSWKVSKEMVSWDCSEQSGNHTIPRLHNYAPHKLDCLVLSFTCSLHKMHRKTCNVKDLQSYRQIFYAQKILVVIKFIIADQH